MANIRVKRGTRAALNAAAAANGLAAGEPYFITDESRFAIGTSTSSFTAFAKETDVSAGPKIWSAGTTYARGETVTSPLDWEDYRRIVATGTDTTDPANDTTKYRAVSYRQILALPVPNLVGLTSYTAPTWGSSAAVSASSNTRTSIFSATGRGLFTSLALYAGTIPSGTRIEVEIDGRVILNVVTTAAMSGANAFLIHAGGASNQTATADGITVEFKRSMNVIVTPNGANMTSTLYHRVVSQG